MFMCHHLYNEKDLYEIIIVQNTTLCNNFVYQRSCKQKLTCTYVILIISGGTGLKPDQFQEKIYS